MPSVLYYNKIKFKLTVLVLCILQNIFLLSANFQDFNEWVVKYVTINSGVLGLRDRVELNLMLLDVSEVNQNLKQIIKSLKHRILDYYMALTRRTIFG